MVKFIDDMHIMTFSLLLLLIFNHLSNIHANKLRKNSIDKIYSVESHL